jgi:uncharacterized protein
MPEDLKVANVNARPGEMAFGQFTVGRTSWSQEVNIPLIVVNGAHEGPGLWLSAVIHGPEATGTEVVRRVLREKIDPSTLCGSIVCVPIANPLAFQDSSYGTPYDGFNLNRVFPGNPNGSITHRMAAALYAEAKKCDFILDLHANPVPALQFCIVAHAPDPKVVERSFEVGRTFGLTTRLMKASEEAQWATSRSGTLLEIAASDGIPGCIAELLYWYRIDSASVEVGTRGVLNIMKALGMIQGEIEKQDVLVIDGELAGSEQTCNEGGLVYFSKQVGDAVTQGETVAIVRDPYGDVLEQVKAPVTGWLTAYPLNNNQAATSGDTIAFFVYRKN